ncbi:hypothetical protein KQH62_03120 [bacterium]|nr:hypothetical protein [bacterium]
MKKKTFFKLFVFLILLIIFLGIIEPVQADSETIPASGQLCVQGTCYEIQVTFSPKGGPVSGSLSGTKFQDNCTLDSNGILSGTFSGGDDGEIIGAIEWTMVASCDGGSTRQTWTGTWQGTLSSDGSGSGTGNVMGVGGEWTVSFSSDDFNRILTPITKEYFKITYGIDVIDGTAKWTDKQLQLLDDVIRKLPYDFWSKCKVTKIIRDNEYVNNKGVKNPKIMGTYTPTDRAISLFDASTKPSYFPKDTTGDKDFISTLVHELTHSYQYYSDYKSVHTSQSLRKSTLIKGFRVHTQDEPLDFKTGWAWNVKTQRYEFLGTDSDNQLINDYAGTNMYEDLCESVAFYMVDPEKLEEKSPNRYKFIKDQMFGGVEYETNSN